MSKEEQSKSIWKVYQVELHFTSPFAAGIPKDPKGILAMLENRQPSESAIEKRLATGEVIKPIPELAAQVMEEVEETEVVEPVQGVNRVGFKSDDKGMYYEARCVRAHIKDCSTQVKGFFDEKALKSKVANKVYVEPEKLYLGKAKPDGEEMRFIHVITPMGERNSVKMVDYVNDATLSFNLRVMNDGFVTDEMLNTIFEYGSLHGMGQERSTGFGRYTFTIKAL